MKRLILLGLILLMAVPGALARKPKKKAGVIEGNTFTDSKYGFKLDLPESWKSKINKDKNDFRLVLFQKNFEVPADYIEAPDFTMVPRVVVFADTTSMRPMPFIDSLVSESFKSKQKNAMMKEFEIFHDNSDQRERIVPRKRKVIAVGDNRGVVWTAQGKYTNYVSLSASSTGGGEKRVQGAYGGAVIAVMHEKNVVVFHLICEWQYFQDILKEVMAVVQSLRWE